MLRVTDYNKYSPFHNVSHFSIFHIYNDLNEYHYECGKCYNDLHCETEEVGFYAKT